VREYSSTFGIDREKLKFANDEAIVMHPGPVNRGVELSHDLTDHRPSVILDQVRNGVAIRMAVLYLLSGRRQEGEPKVDRDGREREGELEAGFESGGQE
jgi:aspartate carbamoyltransferase catalytic subunit